MAAERRLVVLGDQFIVLVVNEHRSRRADHCADAGHKSVDLSWRAGAITIIISHRFSTVAGADLILVMDSGRLIESGSHDWLLALGGRYAGLYGIQAAGYAP